MGKRGQVTLFIILGILVLLLVFLLLYLFENQGTRPQVVEPEFIPINNYVDECISMVSTDALKLMGTQGGYIELPQEISTDANSYLSLGKGIVKVPFWYYSAKNRMPYLLKADGNPSIQEQLEGYVSAHLGSCLQNFSAFQDAFDVTPGNKITTEFSIGEDSVSVYVDYKLKIREFSKNKVSTLSRYHIEIPLQLRKIYDTAQKIMQQENENMYLEKMTIDLMGMNTRIPFSGMTFDCGGKQWFLADIRKELLDMLYYSVPLIRIYHTNYPPFLEQPATYEGFKQYTTEKIFNGQYPPEAPPDDSYDYFNYFWDVKIPENNLKVGFLYLKDWNFNINAYPSDNGILRSNVEKGANQFLSFMCLNMYHFTYDIEYPVEVIIRDDTALMDEGYTFQFAFPVLIDHNNGDREKVGTSTYETVVPYTGYCDNLAGPVYDIRAIGIDEYGLAVDDLPNVNITYNCLKYRCSLGTTTASGGVNALNTQLPSGCAHGYITAEMDGYLKGELQAVDNTFMEVKLKKLKKFNFTIVNNKYHGGVIDPDEVLTSNVGVYMTLQSYDEPSLLMYKKFPLAADAADAEKTITLIEENGKYKVDIFMIDELDDLIIGGYKCNWTVDYNDLQGKNGIVFHTLEYLPKPFEDQQKYDMLKVLDDGSYCETSKPEFIADFARNR